VILLSWCVEIYVTLNSFGLRFVLNVRRKVTLDSVANKIKLTLKQRRFPHILFTKVKKFIIYIWVLHYERRLIYHLKVCLFNDAVNCWGYIVSVINIWKHWWNDTDEGKPKYLEKNLSQCHYIHRKYQMEWPGIEPVPLRRKAPIDYLIADDIIKKFPLFMEPRFHCRVRISP
jgi:hypothetical protein